MRKLIAGSLTVLLIAPLTIGASPVEAASGRCTTDPQVRVQVLEIVTQARSRIAAYQTQLQTRFNDMYQAIGDLEDRDSRIRGEWQANADSTVIGAIIEEEARTQIAPHLTAIQQDADALERDLETLLNQRVSVAAQQCSRVSISQSLRLRAPRTKTYSGSTVWKDGLSTVMARYRVRAALSLQARASSIRIVASADTRKDQIGTTKFKTKIEVLPQLRVTASISSQRRDRRSVSGSAQVVDRDEKITLELEGEQPIVTR